MSHRAIFLPGSVLPAEQAYAALLAALESGVDAVAEDLEVYATAEPPGDYSLDSEIAKRPGTVFPDFELEVFDERHQFDPPHGIEPERLAASLRAVWRRAEQPIHPTGSAW